MAGMTEKASCCDIFESMNYPTRNNVHLTQLAEPSEDTVCWINGEYFKLKGNAGEIGTGDAYNACVESAFETSSSGQRSWSCVDVLHRSLKLLKLSKELAKTSMGCKISEHISVFSEWALLALELKNWKPMGVVVVVLSKGVSIMGYASTVAAALASGCSVIIKDSPEPSSEAVQLAKLCTDCSLPAGLLNVIPGPDAILDVLLAKPIAKVVVIGNTSEAENTIARSNGKPFSFLHPGNTSAVVLDTSDLDGAVGKIFEAAWSDKTDATWRVSNVVVQESIANVFFTKLKQKIENPDANKIQFTDKLTIEKMAKLISAAKNVGAEVFAPCMGPDVWGPAVTYEFQTKGMEEDVPVLSVVTCRTALEAVSIVNNLRFKLACSVWTESSSQALELSDQLDAGIIWMNCHGVSSPRVVFQPRGLSGNGHFGGKDGLLEYMEVESGPVTSQLLTPRLEVTKFSQASIVKLVNIAQAAFSKWQNEKKIRQYLCDVAESLPSEAWGHEVHYWAAQSGKTILTGEQYTVKDVCTMQTMIPLGVVAVYLGEKDTHAVNNLIHSVCPLVAAGNVVIVIISPNMEPALKPFTQAFSKHLPTGVCSIVNELGAVKYLAQDPNVSALWLCDDSAHLNKIAREWSTKHMKHIWTTSATLTNCQYLYSRECYRKKTVWLPKVNHFP